MNPSFTVAIVGRPNVGKSRLFNRLAGKRLAIVHDKAGVTRDVKAAVVDNTYTLLDTGGVGLVTDLDHQDLIRAAEEQVWLAVQAADLILFTVDIREGLTALDRTIADRLRHSGKTVLLVANKADTERLAEQAFEFAELGFGDPLPVSAEHGHRFDSLHDHLAEAAGPPPPGADTDPSEEPKRIHLAFVGRPNVGKSSLCNNLLNDQRLVVSEVPGTTRDSVQLDLDWHGADGHVLPYRLVDTAGLRRRKRVDHSIEYFSTLRSREAMEQADIVFLVIDAEEGVTRQDKALAGEILEAGKCVVLLVNKWDVAIDRFRANQPEQYADMKAFRADYARHALKELFFLPDSPVLFVSALRGFSMDRVLKTARALWETSGRQLPTPKVNRLVQDLMAGRSPAFKDGKRFKAYYAVQTGNRPFTFRVFCNRATKLDEPYRRYLQRGFIRQFALGGCPVRFELRGKEVRYAGEEKRRPRNKGGRR